MRRLLDSTGATRREIVHLLLRLQASGPKSYIFITHDLKMAEELTKSISVMQNGKITESGIFSQDYRRRVYNRAELRSILKPER